MNQNDPHRYDDIINLPHHVSDKRPQMSRWSRAAQFAPFAALTGYEDAVNETARLTNEKIELDENTKELLDEKLQLIQQHLEEQPEITITFFKPDEKKAGGTYVTISGIIKKIDGFTRVVVMSDGKTVKIDDILELDCAEK